MKKSISLLLFLYITSPSFAQKDLNLDFEIVARDGNYPVEWQTVGSHIAFLDEKVKKHGVNSLRLQAPANGSNDSDESFYTQTLCLADKSGKEITLRGYIKTENATSAGFFIRSQTGNYFNLTTTFFDKMDGRRLSGTNDWTPILLKIPFSADLYQIEFGIYIQGKGKVWADDLKVFIDGKAYQLAPSRTETVGAKGN